MSYHMVGILSSYNVRAYVISIKRIGSFLSLWAGVGGELSGWGFVVYRDIDDQIRAIMSRSLLAIAIPFLIKTVFFIIFG